MAAIPFNFQLVRGNSLNHKKSCYISKLEINKEWSMECLWFVHSHYKPSLLEFHRNSTGKEILVSGTFTVKRNGYSFPQRKFMQLVETGWKTILIELDNSQNNTDGGSFSITGSLVISLNESPKECVKEVPSKSLLRLSDDYECLLDSKKTLFSDVEINCGAVSFSAHKSILCARSPVFAAMFSTRMKENRESKVNITDLSPEVLMALMTYIYSGKTGKFSFQSAGDLLFAADKYQLQDMKRVCCDFLRSCVSVENVLKALVLGEMHDKDLKGFAMDFICNKCEEFEVLEKTEEWKNLREKRPSLAMDVLSGLVISTNKKFKTSK